MLDLVPPGLPIFAALAGLVLAGVVKGATGLGYATCALPFLVYAVGLKPAIGLVMLPAMATNVAVALQGGHLAETWRGFSPLYLSMLPGIAGGLALLNAVDPRIAVAILGVTVVAYSLFSLARPSGRLGAATARRLQVPAGFANGVLTGLTGSQAMPLVPYVLATPLDTGRAVQAINLGVFMASAVMLAGLVVSGQTAIQLVTLSAICILPALAGVEVGRRLRPLLPEARARQAILLVLLLSGLGMLLR